ncbi:hypothetical protein ACOACO_15615 [Nocardioides sp. CPCC 205120]|uniref:hypothetical protein n=1 Tax=Nocardioides sp. CPCC 205120 TaxID=3406462 RepID=UPI003B50A4AE
MALTRLVDVVMLWQLGREQTALGVGQGFYLTEPVPAAPGYGDLATNWDGQWYRTIAEHGYPTELPRHEGEVQQNPWAFFPLFPLATRLLMTLTGLSFGLAAAVLGVVASTVALCLLHRMVAGRAGTYVALLTTAALSVSPAGAILATGYSEAVSLLVLVLVLHALSRRRYGLVVLGAVVLGFTRPIALALVPVVVVHAVLRWRAEGGLPRAEVVRLALTAAATTAAFGLWPLTAAVVTGEPDAYLATQSAWVLTDERSWQTWAALLLGSAGVGPAVDVAIVLALVLAIVLQPAARVWAPELRAWVLSYGAFLLLTTRPTPSITRYALFLLVVWWPFPTLGRTWHRAAQALVLVGVLALGLALQYEWLRTHYVLSPARLAYP